MIQYETYIVMDSSFSQKFPVDQEQRCMRQLENNTNKGFYNTHLWMELILLQNLTGLECPLDKTLQGGFA